MIAKAQSGDNCAFAEYRKLNAGLFEKLFHRYARHLLPKDHDDLRQEGEIGFIIGMNKYDPKMGKGKSETYIFAWVRAYLAHFARTHGHGAPHPTSSTISTLDDGDEIDLYETTEETLWQDQPLTPEEHLQQQQAITTFQTATRGLRYEERLIAKWRLLDTDRDPETLSAIGAKLGLSRGRIRQMETRIKKKIARQVTAALESV